MSNISQNMQRPERLRRPQPARTTPRRNILGVFSQKADDGPRMRSDTAAAPTEAHPLGLPVDGETSTAERLSPHLNQQDMVAASNLIDRHITESEKYTISTDPDTWGRLSSLAGKVDPNDIAQIAKVVTQSYSEVASMWVDLAGKLREVLNVQSASQGKKDGVPVPEGLTVFVQSDRRVTAKVRMFETGPIHKVQPLVAEASGANALISDVGFDDGQINIVVPSDAIAGIYHGMMLSGDNTPLGAVTLTIPGPEPEAP